LNEIIVDYWPNDGGSRNNYALLDFAKWSTVPPSCAGKTNQSLMRLTKYWPKFQNWYLPKKVDFQ
jgi:hypothetical protein